jgi:hypothetical protein
MRSKNPAGRGVDAEREALLDGALRESVDRHWNARLDPIVRASAMRAARSTERRRLRSLAPFALWTPGWSRGLAVAGGVAAAIAWLALASPRIAQVGREEIASTVETKSPASASIEGAKSAGPSRPEYFPARRPATPDTWTAASRETPALALPATMGEPASLLAHAPDVRRPPIKLSSLSKARRAAKAARETAKSLPEQEPPR